MVRINGREVPSAEGKTLAEFLQEQGFSLTRVAVECNGEIIPKPSFSDRVILDGEVFEIVSFAGGG